MTVNVKALCEVVCGTDENGKRAAMIMRGGVAIKLNHDEALQLMALLKQFLMPSSKQRAAKAKGGTA